jgi:hypothetical protein
MSSLYCPLAPQYLFELLLLLGLLLLCIVASSPSRESITPENSIAYRCGPVISKLRFPLLAVVVFRSMLLPSAVSRHYCLPLQQCQIFSRTAYLISSFHSPPYPHGYFVDSSSSPLNSSFPFHTLPEQLDHSVIDSRLLLCSTVIVGLRDSSCERIDSLYQRTICQLDSEMIY